MKSIIDSFHSGLYSIVSFLHFMLVELRSDARSVVVVGCRPTYCPLADTESGSAGEGSSKLDWVHWVGVLSHYHKFSMQQEMWIFAELFQRFRWFWSFRVTYVGVVSQQLRLAFLRLRRCFSKHYLLTITALCGYSAVC